MSYFFEQKVFGIQYLNAKISNIVVEGYFVKEIFQEKERIIVLKKNKNDEICKTLQNRTILSKYDKYNLVLTLPELSQKFNKKRYNELIKLCKVSKSLKKDLPYSAFKSFFEGNDILSKLKPYRETKITYFIKMIKDRINCISDLFFCDYITVRSYQKRIKILRSDLHSINYRLFIADLTNDKDKESIKSEKQSKENEIDKLSQEKNISARSIATIILSIFSLTILFQQVSISKRQTIIQEKQFVLENSLNQPKFNIYLESDSLFNAENLHIKKINDAYISNVNYDCKILCYLKSKNEINIFNVIDYYESVSYSPQNLSDEFILIGNNNLKKLEKLQNILKQNYKEFDLRRYIKISYNDHTGTLHEEYYWVVPLYGLRTGDFSSLFETYYTNSTLQEIIELNTPKIQNSKE